MFSKYLIYDPFQINFLMYGKKSGQGYVYIYPYLYICEYSYVDIDMENRPSDID